MRSRLVMAAAAATCAMALAACGSSGDSNQAGSKATGAPVELEFQTGLAVDSELLTSLTKETAAFEAAHPGTKINLVPRTTTYEADIKVRLAANNAPDIWSTHGWSLLRYSEFLVPLQGEPWAKNFNPALDAAMKNGDGKFFAYPVDTDMAGVIYNADVLKNVGIDPAGIKTWADFTDVAVAIKNKSGIAPISASGKDNWLAGNVADWMLSGAYTDAQKQQMRDGTFLPDGYRKVLEQVQGWRDLGLFNVDYSSATTDDIARALGAGQTAFVFTQNSIMNNALQYKPDAKLGYFPVPSFVGDTGYLIGGEGQAYGISNKSKNIDAAKAYIAYLAEPENTSTLAAVAGTVPGLTDATAKLGHLQSSYDQFVAPGKFPLVPYFDRVYLPNGIWNTVVLTTDSIITGQSNVDSALALLQTDFKNLFVPAKK